MDAMMKEWTLLVDQSLQRRLSAEKFDAAVSKLHATSPLPGSKIANLLLKPRTCASVIVDPRKVVYLERLLALRKVDASDVLSATFNHSRVRLPRAANTDSSPQPSPAKRWTNAPELDEIVCHRIHKTFATEERPLGSPEGVRALIIVTRWMQVMVSSHNSDTMIQAMAGIQQQPHHHAVNARESLGMLVVGMIENSKLLNMLNNPNGKDVKKNFAAALSSFIPFLSHNSMGSQTSLQIANRLEMSQKQHEIYEKAAALNTDAAENPGLEVAALQLESVMDLPPMNTRAGLFVFLQAMLVARPLADDFTIINYLHSRYKIDPQNMATALITAAFDILANAMYRSEPSSTMFCLKSFLANKVPVLLTQLATSVYPMTLEMCITQALGQVDPNAFPSFSQGFDDIMGNNNSLSEVRQDFLNACALHGLIGTDTVERLLGETPIEGPPEVKHEKNALLEQLKNNFDKVNMLIEEMENFDGNAGAIAGAVAEFIAHLCETQGTMYLKQICNLLSKKPQAMDVMLQFNPVARFVRPLCQFLDDWHYDSDQGEYQPVYDEFGAILVLIMAFVYRYDLSIYDIGITHDSFVAQMMERGSYSMSPDELTEEQARHLSSWLKGLYDSGDEGLSNDVFSSCRPQDFYLIVPTLFRQTVAACSAGILPYDAVKGGLEYLGETFLMPSLIGGLGWMASYALTQMHNDVDALMRIFQQVILNVPTSGDAQAMHSTILATLSSRLERCFRALNRQDPARANVDTLLGALKDYAHYDRSMYASMKELEQWTNAPNSTLNTSLRHTIQQLSQWSMQPNPPSYTHKQVYACWKMLGARRTLQAIIDEIKAQTEAGNGAAALDIGVAIICAPTVEDSPMASEWVTSPTVPAAPRTRINLREQLKHELENAAALVNNGDVLAAESIVRLQRRVEAQLGSSGQPGLQVPAMGLPSVNIVDMQTQGISSDMNQAMDDAAAAGLASDMNMAGMDKQALERSMEELTGTEGLDMSMGMGAGGANGGDIGAELGSLPGLDLSNMGGLGMDMDMGMDMEMGTGGDDDWGLDFDNM